jgi:hypothetical protein
LRIRRGRAVIRDSVASCGIRIGTVVVCMCLPQCFAWPGPQLPCTADEAPVPYAIVQDKVLPTLLATVKQVPHLMQGLIGCCTLGTWPCLGASGWGARGRGTLSCTPQAGHQAPGQVSSPCRWVRGTHRSSEA